MRRRLLVYLDRLLGARIASEAGFALLHCEGAEPAQLDALAASQSGGDLVEDRRDDQFSILLPQMRAAGGDFGDEFLPWSPPAPTRQLFRAIHAARFDAARPGGEPIVAIGTLPLHHAGHRLPRLLVDCPRCGLVLPARSLVHGAHSSSRLLFISAFLSLVARPELAVAGMF